VALYLDDITVSFDGFKALNADADHQRGRAALHHRPQRRGQDHDDGLHHRQDPARQRQGLLRQQHRPAAPERAEIAQVGIGRKFQKPTVYEQLSVFENLELALRADRRVRASLFSRLSGEQLDRIGEMLTHPPARTKASAPPAC
jgi:urea transport system ATP-binding protein